MKQNGDNRENRALIYNGICHLVGAQCRRRVFTLIVALLCFRLPPRERPGANCWPFRDPRTDCSFSICLQIAQQNRASVGKPRGNEKEINRNFSRLSLFRPGPRIFRMFLLHQLLGLVYSSYFAPVVLWGAKVLIVVCGSSIIIIISILMLICLCRCFSCCSRDSSADAGTMY